MNRLSNKLYLGLVAFSTSVLIFALSPALVIAQATTAASTTQKESPFCTNLPATVSKVNSSLSSLESKLTAAQAARDQQLTANRAKWDQELATDRATWAEQRQAQFTKLMSKATTTTEQTAVTAFEASITSAINTRESANDVARVTYRTGVDNAIAAQRSTVSGQVTTLTNAVDAAETTAQSSCAATPTEGTTIRTTFVAAMKTARQAYIADRKSDGNISATVKQLAQTRDTAIAANDATFDASAKLAESTLKAAFGKTTI